MKSDFDEQFRNLHEEKEALHRLDFKDVLAMIIAMLQLVMPIAFAFMGIALAMMLIFKLIFRS